jgi:hypothetical protein
VEEQFYLAWPVVVFATRNDRQLERVCATVAITAALVRALVAFLGPSSWIVNDLLYRATLFRIDGLALGGWLAIRTRHGNMCPRAGARLFMGAVSALVVIGFIDWRWFGSDTMMPESRVMAGLGFPCLALLAAGAIAASLDPRSALAIDRAAAPRGRDLGELRVEGKDFARVEPRLVAEQLGQVPDGGARPAVAQRRAEDLPGAGARAYEPEEQLDGRRLARAVGAEQTDQLAAADGQAETFERRGLAVGLRDILEVDRRR